MNRLILGLVFLAAEEIQDVAFWIGQDSHVLCASRIRTDGP